MEMRPSFPRVPFLFLILMVLVGVVATGQPRRSQRSNTKARWIHFARGESSAVMSGKLYPYKDQMFRFRASKGQKLVVKVTSPANRLDPDVADVVFWIQSKEYLQAGRYTRVLPGIAKNGVTEWGGTLPVKGEYEIIVSNPPIGSPVKRPTTYTLELSIE